MYPETARLELFNDIGVYRVLTKSKGRESTEFLKKVFVDLQKCGVSQHNHQGHPAEMSLWYKNHGHFLRSVPQVLGLMSDAMLRSESIIPAYGTTSQQ